MKQLHVGAQQGPGMCMAQREVLYGLCESMCQQRRV